MIEQCPGGFIITAGCFCRHCMGICRCTHQPSIVTRNVTSVEPEPDDPQNTGSKPEKHWRVTIWLDEFLRQAGFR